MTPVNAKLAKQAGIAPTDELPALAWPGGYPLFYGDNNDTLCPPCANIYREDVLYVDVNWEDENLHCDACSKQIHSAYGDDNDDTTQTP